MFHGSFLRVCRILRFVKKIRFCLLESGRTKPRAHVWCLGRVPKHRNHWQEVEGNGKKQRACYLPPKTLGGPRHGARGLVSWLSAKAQEPVARSRGLVIQLPKHLVGAYFELSFLGYGFLIHLSNRSDNPQFRAPWKKIRQKYDIQQEPSLFKGHPLSCQYGDALSSLIPT